MPEWIYAIDHLVVYKVTKRQSNNVNGNILLVSCPLSQKRLMSNFI